MAKFEMLSDAHVIREADVNDVHALLRACGESDANCSAERIAEVARRNLVVVARDESRAECPIIGFACLAYVTMLDGVHGYVTHTFTAPQYAASGLKEDMICRLMQRGLELGLTRIEAKASADPIRLRHPRRRDHLRLVAHTNSAHDGLPRRKTPPVS